MQGDDDDDGSGDETDDVKSEPCTSPGPPAQAPPPVPADAADGDDV